MCRIKRRQGKWQRQIEDWSLLWLITINYLPSKKIKSPLDWLLSCPENNFRKSPLKCVRVKRKNRRTFFSLLPFHRRWDIINFISRPNKLYLSSITKFKFWNKKNKSVIYETGMQKTIVMICYRFLFQFEWNLLRQTLLLAIIKKLEYQYLFSSQAYLYRNFQ